MSLVLGNGARVQHLIGLSDKTAEFVFSRQKEDGGFGATPHLPSTVEDTYYGLSILNTLGSSKTEGERFEQRLKRAASYLQGRIPQPNWSPRTLYYYLQASEIAETEPNKVSYLPIASDCKRDAQFLEDVYYTYLSRKGLNLDNSSLSQEIFSKVNFSEWRSVKELWLKLELADLAGIDKKPDKGKAASWVTSCQNPDGGFGFYPGSTSFIENCHICIVTLRLLGVPPLDPWGALDFILRCRTARGGFARKNGGAPFLDATWHAISTLDLLSTFFDDP